MASDIFELMETWDRMKPDPKYIGKHRNGTKAMSGGDLCHLYDMGWGT